MKVTSEGKGVATSKEAPMHCMICNGNIPMDNVVSCVKCLCGRYCSVGCMGKHQNHAQYCSLICEVERVENEKRMRTEIFVKDSEKLPYKMKLKLIRLVGERPLVKIFLNGEETQGLWDTGAMISLMNEKFLREHFPDTELLSISEFTGDEFTLTTANKSELNVQGVAILDFGVTSSQTLFQVPFLITADDISGPIIGYNTIEHLVTNFKENLNVSESLVNVIGSLSSEKTESMVNLIERGDEISELSSEAKLEKAKVVFPGCYERLKCKVKDLQFNNGNKKLIVFTPLEEMCVESELIVFESTELLKTRRKFVDIMVYNPTSHDIILKKGSLMGQVSNVASAFTLPMMQKNASVSEMEVNKDTDSITHDLSHLTGEQKEIVTRMLNEEKDVFSRHKNDIGHIKDFKLEINLTDKIPVTEAYRKIPRHLYTEVKNHISDLVANGWIKQSYSPYSSPMVCVRKKGGGLRLCIDFRKLNKKTIPDMQPIPRVQDILDNLNGQSWFTTLDMSQAYHQGEMSNRSRKFTAFSTPWSLYEWVRIPYGIMNAPAGFQRFINNCLAHLSDDICCAYLDDILVFSKSFKQHKINVKRVLSCLRKKGVKLNAGKCNLFKREIRYLGRLISEQGYRPDPEDLKALERCRTPPTDIGKLRSLIGFLWYYRTYIKDC